LTPSAVQISMAGPLPWTAASAWEIVGASALSSIAKHAIQMCSRHRLKNLPIRRL